MQHDIANQAGRLFLPLHQRRAQADSQSGQLQVRQTGLTREQLEVPIKPEEPLHDGLVFEHPNQGRQFYLAHYFIQQERIDGVPRYKIHFRRDEDQWALEIMFNKSMSDQVFASAPEAEALPHRPRLILRYRFSADNTTTRDLVFTEISPIAGGLSAVLKIETLSLRDEVFRALTDISMGAELLMERHIKLAVQSGHLPGAGGGRHEVAMSREPGSKVQVIKLIRIFTGEGLKESKELAEQQVPALLLQTDDKKLAAKFALSLEKAGARAIVRQPLLSTRFSPLANALLIKLIDRRSNVIRGTKFMQYTIAVSNWQTLSDKLFVPSPALPPCGSNTNSSRSWVDIVGVVGGRKQRLYGYCGLDSAKSLAKLSFNVPVDKLPQGIVLVLNDRKAGKKMSSQFLKLDDSTDTRPPPRTTLPPPPRTTPPPGSPLYRLVWFVSSQAISPSPFVFDKNLHDYIFEFSGENNEPTTGLIRIQKIYQSAFYAYYQDASRRHVIYYLPDSFKLARRSKSPYYPDMSVRIRSTDGSEETTEVSMDYTLKPHVDPARLASALVALKAGIGDSSAHQEVDLQPFPLNEFKFFISYPAADGNRTVERNIEATVLREGLRDTLALTLPEFVTVFSSMTGREVTRFSGNIEIQIPGIGGHDIPFNALFEDMVGSLFDSVVLPGIAPATLDITVSNSIESLIHIEQASAKLLADESELPLNLEPGFFPVQIEPDESLVFSAGVDTPINESEVQTLMLDLEPVRVLPDQEKIWNAIVNRSATEFFRVITVVAADVFFEVVEERPDEQIVSIFVHFEGGDSVELTAGEPRSTARIDYLVDDLVLNRETDSGYRYAVEVVRMNGVDPRSDSLDGKFDLLLINVGR